MSMKHRFLAKYLIETALAPAAVAEVIAGEQSSGTFLPVPGETDALKRRARARVEEVVLLDRVAEPSLPGAAGPKRRTKGGGRRRAEITLSFPADNIGANLPTLLATLCGNLYELREHSGCKLLDFEVPAGFREHYPGPQFGVAGTRRLSNVFDRPLIGTIIKPSVGLSPRQTAALVRRLGKAEIDFIKDDELMADPPHCPLRERVKLVMHELNQLAGRTGRKVMYAFNISDDADEMLRHHDTVLAAGGTCVMVSVNSVGFSAVARLRRHSQLPIHAHRNGWGMFTRHPLLGLDFAAYQKFWRLAGVDHLHVNGLQNKFWEPDDSVVRSIQSCLDPLPGETAVVMPVVSSGQWGGQAPETYRRTQTVDLIYLAGGGIMAHPLGPAAGVRALQQAWSAAIQGIPLADQAARHPELCATLAHYGGRRQP